MMAETTTAPVRNIDRITAMIDEYAALAATRPLTDEEQTRATERYFELLHAEPEPMTDARREELEAMTRTATAHLVNDDQRTIMMENARRIDAGEDIDPVPVVRLFSPVSSQSWLLTELRGDMAYGLCDLGIGLPECGDVSLSWIAGQSCSGEEYRPASPYGVQPAREVHTHMRIERDPRFPKSDTPTLSYLDRVASVAGRIVL